MNSDELAEQIWQNARLSAMHGTGRMVPDKGIADIRQWLETSALALGGAMVESIVEGMETTLSNRLSARAAKIKDLEKYEKDVAHRIDKLERKLKQKQKEVKALELSKKCSIGTHEAIRE